MSSFHIIPLITDAALRRLVFLPISQFVRSSIGTDDNNFTLNTQKMSPSEKMIARLAFGQQLGNKHRPLLPPTLPFPSCTLVLRWRPVEAGLLPCHSDARSLRYGFMNLNFKFTTSKKTLLMTSQCEGKEAEESHMMINLENRHTKLPGKPVESRI